MDQRTEARQLRADGRKVADISAVLGVPKSTVSAWTRDIKLTSAQHEANGKSHLRDTDLHARRAETIRVSKRQKVVSLVEAACAEADAEWADLQTDPSFLFALALYVGEGTKVGSAIDFANCDPRVIRIMLRFYERIGIEPSRIRLRNNVHQGNDLDQVREFWLRETGLAPEQYNKSSIVPARKNGNKFPMGICYIKASDVHIRRKLDRWMELALETSRSG